MQNFCEKKNRKESFFAQLIVAAPKLIVFAEFFFRKIFLAKNEKFRKKSFLSMETLILTQYFW